MMVAIVSFILHTLVILISMQSLTVKGVEIIQFQIQDCLVCSKLASLVQQQFGKILRLLHCYLGMGLAGVVQRRLNHVLNRCPLGIQSCISACASTERAAWRC